MKDTERYQIAKEVYDEFYGNDEGNANFITFINHKLKEVRPADPLKEKFEKWFNYEEVEVTEDDFESFKKTFAEDFNGTKGLDKFIEQTEEKDSPQTFQNWNGPATAKFILDKAKEIKKELEA